MKSKIVLGQQFSTITFKYLERKWSIKKINIKYSYDKCWYCDEDERYVMKSDRLCFSLIGWSVTSGLFGAINFDIDLAKNGAC